ncbi:MAG: OmpA family protein [Alphaproteobacteria bacterium]
MADPLDNLTSSEQLKRLLLQEEQERIEHLEARLGDDDALKTSLVPIIADVLRDAGVKDYRRLADALAPIVLQSIKTEIHNSRDMMVDALYPITGRLVAAAVRNAFKDLVDQLNSKLDSTLSVDRWRAKLKATLSGRSEAEVLLSEGAAFEIVDLLLIDRQSGLLIAQARQDGEEEGTDSHLLSSILTAIMAFVRDAMSQSSEQELRTLHVGDLRLHLQVSPSAILAIKTKGPPPVRFETALSETFYAFLSRWGDALSEPGEIESHDQVGLTEDLDERFQVLLKAKQANFRQPSKKGVVLLASLAVIAASWIGWTFYKTWSADRIERIAQSVIDQRPDLKGYPIDIHYLYATNTLAISGLMPSQQTTEVLRGDLEKTFPEIALSMEVNSLPGPGIDLESVTTQADFAEWRKAVSADIHALGDDVRKEFDDRQQSQRDEILTNLDQRLSALQEDTARNATIQRLDQRISALADAVSEIEPRLPTTAEIGEAAFRSWLDRQSIRFGDDRQFIDDAKANDLLESIANYFSILPGNLALRIVGYSDDLGADNVSDRIARLRAALVADKLSGLGIPADRLKAVGRGNEKRIADVDGTGSANRRVEFELTYLDDISPADDRLGGANRGTR